MALPSCQRAASLRPVTAGGWRCGDSTQIQDQLRIPPSQDSGRGSSSICSAYPRGWALESSQTPPRTHPPRIPFPPCEGRGQGLQEQGLVSRDGCGRLGQVSQLLSRDLCPVTEMYQTFPFGASVVSLLVSSSSLSRTGTERVWREDRQFGPVVSGMPWALLNELGAEDLSLPGPADLTGTWVICCIS